MTSMKHWFTWTNGIILCIVILAFFLRINALEIMPSGFHRDEVLSGYFGKFIIENGHDIYGNILPLLYVDKYGDYPPALPMYLSGISTFFLGPTVFATRLPIALVGVLMLLPLFFLTKTIFQDKRIALFSLFIVAVMPWHIILSRATAEGIVALTVVTWGLLHLVQFIKNQNPRYLIAALVLFFLTYFLYPSYRILIPLIILPIPFLFPFKKLNRLLLFGGFIFFVLVTLFISSTDWGRGRFDQTSVFGKQGQVIVQPRIEMLSAQEGPNNIPTVKTYHNKYIMQGKEIIAQYLSYFSPHYLFTAGGLPYRYSIPDVGLLPLTLFPLFFITVLYLKDIQKRMLVFLLYLLLISPLPAPLTIDDVPNVHRTMFMIIPFTLFASFGLIKLTDTLKKHWVKYPIILIFFAAFFIELMYFQHMYYHHGNAVKSDERGDTNKEMLQYAISEKNNYDEIRIPALDAFPFYYLFFTNNFDKSLINKIEKNLIVKQIDNIMFFETYCAGHTIKEEDMNKKILVFNRDECNIDAIFEHVTTFTRHDGTNAYSSYRLKNSNKQ